jgi:hypothetical protein
VLLGPERLEHGHHRVTNEERLFIGQHMKYFALVHFGYESWLPACRNAKTRLSRKHPLEHPGQ